jgi:putative membrane protein
VTPNRWHRLHPLSPAVRAGRGLIPLLFVVVAPSFQRGAHDTPLGHLIGLVVVLVFGLISWLVTRWRVEDGALRIETGLLRRSSRRFPLSQVQAIDTVRPGIARVLGLAELRLRMGGQAGGSGRLAYLPAREADALRARLLAIAHGVAEDAPAPPEEVLLTLPTGRLAASIAISRPGLQAEAVLVLAIVLAFLAPSALGPAFGGGLFVLLGFATSLWRRFNGEYRMTVAEAPDGLRLRSGLVETTAETIPRGRVQAVRMVEPLLWRPLGWCRLEVDVAGHQRRHGEDQPEGGELRAVLPVGPRADARRLLGRIVPDAPDERVQPPPRARWKSPLRYRNLSWGRNDRCAVTTSGRVRHVTVWVPLAKVQSFRRVQGPVQRRLRLVTLHLDTAGRTLHGALRDRGADEAEAALEELVAHARAARVGSQHARAAARPADADGGADGPLDHPADDAAAPRPG